MKKLFILFIVFTSLAHYANAMSNSKSYNGILPNGMTSYQIRIMGGNWLNFQGIVAFYDKDGKPKTQRVLEILHILLIYKVKKAYRLISE